MVSATYLLRLVKSKIKGSCLDSRKVNLTGEKSSRVILMACAYCHYHLLSQLKRSAEVAL